MQAATAKFAAQQQVPEEVAAAEDQKWQWAEEGGRSSCEPCTRSAGVSLTLKLCLFTGVLLVAAVNFVNYENLEVRTFQTQYHEGPRSTESLLSCCLALSC